MKIDRMYFDKFEETVKEDPVAREQYEQGNYPAVIRYIDDHIMNQPNEYYTWDKLRRSIGSDRRITAREILDKIFGVLPFFKSKKELVEDEFEGYALTHSIPSEKYADVKEFFANLCNGQRCAQSHRRPKIPAAWNGHQHIHYG